MSVCQGLCPTPTRLLLSGPYQAFSLGSIPGHNLGVSLLLGRPGLLIFLSLPPLPPVIPLGDQWLQPFLSKRFNWSRGFTDPDGP